MNWTEQTRAGLETALNEAEVVGLRVAPADAACELLLHVHAQPAPAGTDPDPRRVLRLLRTSRIRVVLRADRMDGYGPAIPLTGLAEVEAFFASLDGWEAMYGWEFLDRPTPDDWPVEPSLTVAPRPGPSPHSLYWFTDCRRADGRYCIEGTVDFADLEVLRGDGAPEPVEEFAAEARHWWNDLSSRGMHLPQPAGSPSWRGPRLASTFVAG